MAPGLTHPNAPPVHHSTPAEEDGGFKLQCSEL